jgi:hypothetical protein
MCSLSGCREIDTLERFGRGRRDHAALDIEARTVTGTIPCSLSVVPVNDAAEMRAYGGNRLDLVAIVSVCRNEFSVGSKDRGFSWFQGVDISPTDA